MHHRPLLTSVAIVLALVACGPGGPPANPTVGQTWNAPGNEDTCVWTADGRWAETDDGDDCEDSDRRHTVRTTRTHATTAPPRPSETRQRRDRRNTKTTGAGR